ncbi:hypothetical protein C7S18_01635 [Ahniella affigens]|uniref:Uroporphyrinogen-III synthase n=1 Tax=Ahniella affigens TaxID=2021234 RepID=A0A2P1PMB5_9GAMM|nr:uroporphyrinogen-III synthase [Ahniella affigens]AVP95972.1 hypothetical protein C7S18_01635 [Ahniella affigens]
MPVHNAKSPALIHLAVQDGQDGLTRALRRLPMSVIRVAALIVRAVPDLAELRPLAEQASVWIFASSNAVRCFAPVAGEWHWPAHILTQGPGTRRALDAFGRPSLSPLPPYDSEAMLAMPIWSELPGGRVLRISGAQGREWLANALTARGFATEAVAAYMRVPTPVRASVAQRLAALSVPPLVVFTSAEAAQAVRGALPEQWPRLLSGTALVPSERLAQLAQSWGFAAISRADSAAQADVVAAVRRHLPKVRATE